MKILLVGEYSGVHYNLYKALVELNYKVDTLHDGDSYKNFPASIELKYEEHRTKHKLFNKFLNFYYLFLEFIGFKGIIQFFLNYRTIRSLRNYDVVQLINPIALSGFGSIVNLLFIYYLKYYNNKIFLCALGDDYYWVKDQLNNKKNGIFNDMNIKNFYKYLYSLKYYYGFLYPYLNKKVLKISHKVIPGLYDYYKVYSWSDKCSEIVPIIIDLDIYKDAKPFKFENYPISIFHGWQVGKELRKGNNYFHSAVKKLEKDYPELVSYQVIKSVPYQEYIQLFSQSTIFLDQCLSMDKGVNALLGMANGKIVLTGNVDGQNSLCDSVIKAIPNENYIYNIILSLVKNPSELERVSSNAITYIRNRHSPDKVVKKILQIWELNENQ